MWQMRIWAALLLAYLAAFSLPAWARPRDEVMSTAFRCSVIANDRTWLNCIYGAAQPVRSQLQLPPAPASQVELAKQPPSGGNANDTSSRDAVMGNAAQCYHIADNHQWLNCYYEATQPMRTKLGLPKLHFADTSGTNAFRQNSTMGLPQSRSRSSGGFLSRLVPSEQVLVTSRMASYNFDRDGLFTVALQNGQIWHERPGNDSNPNWRKPANSYVVTISDGAFGSFNFRVKGDPRMFKVERIN